MSPEFGLREAHAFERKGIALVENKEASILENTLGIEFDHKPSKVPLTKRNLALISLTRPSIKDQLELSVGHLVRSGSSSFRGSYLAKLYAFFYWPSDTDTEQAVSLHENMHGYVYQINPELRTEVEELARDIQTHLDPKTLANLIYPDSELRSAEFVAERLGKKLFPIKCLDEGVAEWAALEVRLRMKGYDEEKRSESHKFFIEKKIRGMDQESRPYALGHFYVFFAMTYLREEGMSDKEALDFIIQNPPTSEWEVRHPQDYIPFAQNYRSLPA